MASSESNTFEESTQPTTSRENMSTENTTAQMQNEFEMETQKDENLNSTSAAQRSASYRGIRLSETDTSDEQPVDDSWWGEIENNDLLLDQVPNVTAVFTPTPEAILEKSISLAESESVLKEENFERLHKIAEKIKMTLSEHAKNKEKEEVEQTEKERKLSESSDKENKTDNLNIDCSKSILIAHKQQSLEEFKEELRTKRLERQNAVQDLRDEIATLRRQLAFEREVNKRLRRGEQINETSSLTSTLDSCVSVEDTCGIGLTDYEDVSSRSRHANIELANAQLALQMANSENISLRSELAVVQKQVVTLKEVIACCKQMLAVKEEQCNEIFR